MTYTPEQIATHIDQRAAAVGENSADVRILRQLVAQVETEREENRWAYINAGLEDAALSTQETPQ